MAHYRKIDVAIHNDAKFMEMSDRGKLLWFTLLTHPHLTGIGAMKMSQSGMAEEMGWTLKAFQEAFGEALSKGMIWYDEKTLFLCFPNFLKHNRPESPNVVKSWAKVNGLLPECPLKSKYLQIVKDYVEGMGEAFAIALPKDYAEENRKPSLNQEQEQEQEHKKNKERESTTPTLTPNNLAKVWNETAPTALARVLLPLGKARQAQIRPALKDHSSPEWWITLFSKAGGIPGLIGQNDRGWRADFDWVIKNRDKILEGKYDNWGKNPKEEMPRWMKLASQSSSPDS